MPMFKKSEVQQAFVDASSGGRLDNWSDWVLIELLKKLRELEWNSALGRVAKELVRRYPIT